MLIMKKQTSADKAAKGTINYLIIGSAKLKLENYSAGKKLKTKRYIAVFGIAGAVKLLNTSQLLPLGVPATMPFAGLGRQLIETFSPVYGSGISTIAGRFFFQHSNNYYTDSTGWVLNRVTNQDQELEFVMSMGAWTGPEPSPVQNFMVLEVHVFCPSEITLTITVDGAEVSYHFDPIGEDKVVLYLRKPADSNQSRINIKLKGADNSLETEIWISRIERYTSIFLPAGEIDTLEI
jgi:hypothetical protein